MNCDQVFDILTRGPFPTGTACDTAVEIHLGGCPECHRLAEALRPAIELFQEAIGPEESRDLPGYWCAVATDRSQPVVSYTRAVEPRPAPTQEWSSASVVRGFSSVSAWRMVAMLMLGVTLGTLAAMRFNVDNFSIPPFSHAAGSAMSAPEGRPRLTPAQHSALAVLPAACTRNRPVSAPRYTVRGDQLLAQANLDNLTCCSNCHNAHSDMVPHEATAVVAQRCQLCHSDKQ
jgi:hypothetical protein